MHMMTSLTLKLVDSSKTERSKYFEDDRLFFLQIKKWLFVIH